MPKRILVVDDDRAVLQSCENILTDEGYEVQTAAQGFDGLELLKHKPFDLALVDLKMPGMNGLQMLEAARRLRPELVVIIFTAYATIETAVEAIKLGAFNYVTKPFKSSELVATVEKGLMRADLARQSLRQREETAGVNVSENMIWQSPVMEATLNTLRKVASSDANILVTGESGTGKELAAKFVHFYSRRANQPFVAVDCAAIPDNLLESELFGYEKGAFTGADHRKRGLLELADGGTLLLDEIGEMSMNLQARLLRVLQERVFRRLGAEKVISVNIRLISSTNRDLEARVRQEQFRSDLLFRLNVVNVQMPPLRERQGDVAILCQHFLEIHARNLGRSAIGLSPEAIQALEHYHWPGNVRELQNILERAVVLNEGGVISVADLPDFIPETVEGRDQIGGRTAYKTVRSAWLDSQGKQYFSELLARHKGNVSSAAREAQISRKSFYQLMKKFDLEPNRRPLEN
jgi:two-component system response regulator AtoC